MVAEDEAFAGLKGTVVIGLRKTDGYKWWRADFGQTVDLSFPTEYPEDNDVALFIGDDDARHVLDGHGLPETPELLQHVGNSTLLKKFLDRYTGEQLSFYYHMYGADMGSLYVDVDRGADGTWDDLSIWSRTGQQHTSSSDTFSQGIVDLSSYTGTVRVRFRGVDGNDYRGDIAIDDISVTGTRILPTINITATDASAACESCR